MREIAADVVSRALNTFSQSLGASLAVSATIGTVAWGPALSIAGLAALISVLQTVARHTASESTD